VIPFLAMLLVVSLPSEWTGWRYSRELKTSAMGLNTFVCPRQVYDHSGVSLADVRIIDGKNQEVPFALQKQPIHNDFKWRTTKMVSDNSKGSVVDLTFDTGEEHQVHNTMQLEVSDQDFLSRVEISASDDPNKDWRVVRSSLPIYRFMPDGLEGNQTVNYANSDTRYIRVRVTPQAPDGATEAVSENAPTIKILHVQIGYDESKRPDWIAYSPIFSPDMSSSTLQTWWRSDALIDTLPINAIRVTAINKEFFRALKISASPNARDWTMLAATDIFSLGGDRPIERVVIDFPDTSMRYWRVQFYDNGAPALVISKIELLGVPQHVVFKAGDNGPYRILYGNGKSKAPDYEWTHSLPKNAFQGAAEASLGDEQENIFDKRGIWFWVMVGGGIIAGLIGIAVLVSLLSEDSESHEPL
jgi:hypothetical protein